MPYTYATPAAQPAAVRPPDGAMVAEAAGLLHAVTAAGLDGWSDRAECRAWLATPLARLCVEAKRRELPVEGLIVAIKHARALLAAGRWRTDSEAELFTDIITVCIEQYFAPGNSLCALAEPGLTETR